ncbi:hypothetical protein K440DRAFT_665136 [Wilcoxina mikolae CBS 423.85]|nr:hypothetical protein K440DRAFT_665136 [Wilcoxina mikolae CBS 423.85]
MYLSRILLSIALLSTQIAVGLPTENSGNLGNVEVVGSPDQIGVGGSPGNVESPGNIETGGAVSSVVTPSGAILHRTADNFEYLELPQGMNVSHPSFDIQKLISLAESGQELPKIPGVPDPGAFAQGQDYPVIKGGLIKCQTTEASPWMLKVWENHAALAKIKDKWCCQLNAGSYCRNMQHHGNAATDICHWGKKGSGVCISCNIASVANYEVMDKCKWNSRAGGYMRFGSIADVNVYTWKE